MSIEANLTSHLSISYSAAPTASGTPAAASGTTAPAGAASAAPGGSMAGFLAALVDQLLAGAAATSSAGTVTEGDTTSAAPAAFGPAVDPATLTAIQSTPRGNLLFAQLTNQLKALQDQLDKGETPDPDLLKKLGDTADAIAALIAVPTPPAAAAVNPSLAPDPFASIGQSSEKPKSDPLAGLLADTPASAAGQQPAVSGQIAQFLASLGLQAPANPVPSGTVADASADQSAGTATPAQPLPAIAQLAGKLAALTQTVAAASPELAQKLDALAKKLDAAEATPQAFAPLTVASDTDGSELDRVVQALMATKPANQAAAPAPTLAAKTELPTPAPILGTAAQSDTTQALAPATAGPSTAAAPKITSLAGTGDATTGDTTKPDAKVIAAATIKDDTKPADSADTTNQQGTTSAAPSVAPATTPRAIPAAYQAASSPINMGQVAFEMVRQVHQGTSRFSFRLDPPELGRVDVKMHVDASGTVSARLTVERSETLDMFQRDRGALEKALSQAGLDSGKTNLEFSLKQNQQNPFAGFSGSDQRPTAGSNAGTQFSLAGSADDGDDAVSAPPSITLYRGIASAGGVNLFV